ncbi:hypothetical protein GQ53DRAFT_525839 [Thozetella sp. PMI_491]|nr:hypothetical protein GQ53DRAFT_525839 [Thozetella sp. PMI_491]
MLLFWCGPVRVPVPRRASVSRRAPRSMRLAGTVYCIPLLISSARLSAPQIRRWLSDWSQNCSWLPSAGPERQARPSLASGLSGGASPPRARRTRAPARRGSSSPKPIYEQLASYLTVLPACPAKAT